MCMCVCVYVCVCVCVDCEAGWTLYSQDYEYLNGTTQRPQVKRPVRLQKRKYPGYLVGDHRVWLIFQIFGRLSSGRPTCQ